MAALGAAGLPLLVIVSGPWARAVGLCSGAGLFGPGFRANATIGRAIRLILMNVGGAWPGRHDMATQGSPAKFSYAIAEREDASPWEPLHAGLGFGSDQSVVTVYAGEAPQKVTDDSAMLPQVPAPDDVFVIVAGGSGKHSAVIPNCTFSRAVSRVIDRIR